MESLVLELFREVLNDENEEIKVICNAHVCSSLHKKSIVPIQINWWDQRGVQMLTE